MANARFIKSITKASAAEMPAMPWARGKRRADFIAKRHAVFGLQDMRQSA